LDTTNNAINSTETRDPAPAPRELIGTDGRDFLRGGEGNDILAGGRGDDRLDGFAGDDTFVFNTGDGRDTISSFNRLGNDRVILNVDGINSFEDLLATARVINGNGGDLVRFDFGNGDRLSIFTESFEALTADDFLFNIDPADAPALEPAPSTSGTNSSVVDLLVDSADDIPADNNPGSFTGEITTITRPQAQEPVEAAPVVVEPAPVVEAPVQQAPVVVDGCRAGACGRSTSTASPRS